MAPKTMKTKASLKIIEDAPLEKKSSGRSRKEVPDMELEGVEITPAEKVKLGRRGKAKDINYSDTGKDKITVSKPRANAKAKKTADSNGITVEPDVKKKEKKRYGKTASKTEENEQIDNDDKSVDKKPPTKGKKKNEVSITNKDDIPKQSKKGKATKGSKKLIENVRNKSVNGNKASTNNEEIESNEEIEVDKKSTKGKERPKKETLKKNEIIDDDSSENFDKHDHVDEESDVDQEPPLKRGKKTKSAPAKAPMKNKSVTSYEDIDFSNKSKDSDHNPWNMKISCWNVDGIRAWLNKGGLDFIKYEKPDILCVQETKCAKEKLPEEVTSVPGYHDYWLCSDKDGYAGVCIYTNKMAISVQNGLKDPDLDDEGRIITAEFKHFYLICTYVPNAGRKLVTLPKRLKWNEAFHKHVKALDSKKPVIICGDMNVAHNEIDLKNPKTNRKNAGFTNEERAGMTALLNDGFVDTFRHLYPDKTDAFTFWTYMMNSRAKNVGWRLDYFIVSERLLGNVCDNVIRSEVYGSDHCPITLFLHFKTLPRLPSE